MKCKRLINLPEIIKLLDDRNKLVWLPILPHCSTPLICTWRSWPKWSLGLLSTQAVSVCSTGYCFSLSHTLIGTSWNTKGFAMHFLILLAWVFWHLCPRWLQCGFCEPIKLLEATSCPKADSSSKDIINHRASQLFMRITGYQHNNQLRL